MSQNDNENIPMNKNKKSEQDNVISLDSLFSHDEQLASPLDLRLAQMIDNTVVPKDLSTRILIKATAQTVESTEKEAPLKNQAKSWQRALKKLATIIGTALVASIFLLRINQPALADEVIEHVIHDQVALTNDMGPPRAALDLMLSSMGVTLDDSKIFPTRLRTIRLCDVGKSSGVHAVFQGQKGSIAVIFLSTEADESLATRFEKDHLQGHFKVVGDGLVAIVGEQGEDLSAYTQFVDKAVLWPKAI